MNEQSLSKICTLHYGKALRGYSEKRLPELSARVYGTNRPIGWTQEPLSIAPTIIIGRKGAYRGVHYSEIPSGTIDTAYFLTLNDNEFDLRWLYYRLRHQRNELWCGDTVD